MLSARPLTEVATWLNLTFPLSILDMSRISLIRLSRSLPERMILLKHSSSLALSSISFLAISAKPRMAFMGVLISWDILFRNTLLALLADSAMAKASSSFFLASCSLLKRSWMLLMVRNAETGILPCFSWIINVALCHSLSSSPIRTLYLHSTLSWLMSSILALFKSKNCVISPMLFSSSGMLSILSLLMVS